MKLPGNRIASLDGLRGTSILLVLTGQAVDTIRNHHLYLGGAATVLANARPGVMTFRVLTSIWWPDARPFITIMLHTNADPLMLGSLIALLEGNRRFETALRYLLRGWLPAAAAAFALLVSPLLNDNTGRRKAKLSFARKKGVVGRLPQP